LAAKTITLSVTRFDPGREGEPRQQSYEIPFEDDMVVLDGLNWIKTHLDGSVSYRWSCRMVFRLPGHRDRAGVHRPGGDRPGQALRARLARPGRRRAPEDHHGLRRNLGLQLRR
jgi:hypothetical protein